MYNIKLNEGDKVKIYLEPKSDFSEVECDGVLISKEDYSCTFVMDYEQMYIPKSCSLHFMDASVDKKRIYVNNIHEYLHHYLNNPESKDIFEFKKSITNKCNNRLNSFSNMYKEIQTYKAKYKNVPYNSIHNVLSVDSKYIIRYIHQEKYKENWRPSLFELQKWKVKLYKDNDPFFIPFVSYRYIKVLKKICPTDRVVANLTSNNFKYSKYL